MNKINNAAGPTRLGAWGEQAAAEYLSGLGWRVVARNWRGDGGELDLVALEPVEGAPPVGVVVEVKCRRGTGFGDPLEAITRQKNSRLRRLAGQWWQAIRSRCRGCGWTRSASSRFPASGPGSPTSGASSEHRERLVGGTARDGRRTGRGGGRHRLRPAQNRPGRAAGRRTLRGPRPLPGSRRRRRTGLAVPTADDQPHPASLPRPVRTTTLRSSPLCWPQPTRYHAASRRPACWLVSWASTDASARYEACCPRCWLPARPDSQPPSFRPNRSPRPSWCTASPSGASRGWTTWSRYCTAARSSATNSSRSLRPPIRVNPGPRERAGTGRGLLGGRGGRGRWPPPVPARGPWGRQVDARRAVALAAARAERCPRLGGVGPALVGRYRTGRPVDQASALLTSAPQCVGGSTGGRRRPGRATRRDLVGAPRGPVSG